MMFHPCDDHLIARPNVFLPEAVGRQVNRLGGSPDEDDLSRGSGSEEAGNRQPSLLVESCGLVAQFMHTPMNIGARVIIKSGHRVQDGPRLLGRCRIIKVN